MRERRYGAFYIPDEAPLLPEQLSDSTSQQPEKRLLAAILREAVQCFYGKESEENREEAEDWFLCGGLNDPFGFEPICLVLGIDPEYARGFLLAERRKPEMSYWVTLCGEDGAALQVPTHREGGTFVFDGTRDASLNVTYNYGQILRSALHPEGIRYIHGKSGGETSLPLLRASASLGTKKSEDYWEPTNGNVGFALGLLGAWASIHPQGEWDVS